MDTPDLVPLLLAAIAFVGSHIGVSSTPLRPLLIARLGRGVYLGLYSLVSILCLIWLVAAFAATPFLPLWPETHWARWIAVALMPLALILVAGGLSPANPTLLIHRAGGPTPRGVFAITRHPMMWGIALTAILHLLASGDAASLILCGAMAVLALVGAAFQDRRKRTEDPAGWRVLAAETSFWPFQALAAGRTRLAPRALVLPVVAGLAAYLVMAAVHQNLFGVSPFH